MGRRLRPTDFPSARPGDRGTAAERQAACRRVALIEENRRRLDRLLSAERPSLEAAARRVLSCRASAEDAVQEAALRASATVRQFSPDLGAGRDGGRGDAAKGYKAWFYAVLMNVCLDMARANGRQVRGVPFTALPDVVIEAASVDPAPGPLDLLLRGMGLGTYHPPDGGPPVEFEDVTAALDALNAHDRWVVEECIIADREEIAVAEEAGDRTPGSIRSRLMTAKERLETAYDVAVVRRKMAEAERAAGAESDGA